jgi:hypothetical protein
MSLPLITDNMYFDTVLKAIEDTLNAEAINQVNLGGTGWKTVRERFDPWNVAVDEMNPGVVNVTWSASNFPDSEGNNFDQTSISTFDIDCYASESATETGGVIIPKDQQSADVLHTLVTRVYYTVMSPIYYDLGLTPGTIVRPWVTGIVKFIPTETNIPVQGVIAARISCRVQFCETPPEKQGVDLEIINVKTDTDQGAVVDQTFNL